MAKRTKQQADEIRKDIADMLCEFPPRKFIIEYCKEKYNIKEAQIDNYTRDARLLLASTLYNRKERFWQHIQNREKLYRRIRSSENPDFDLILKILDSMAKIEGLNIDRFAMTDTEGKALPITSITVALQEREDELDKEEKENE